MKIFVIADLHLSFGTPNKEMDIFGPEWKDHPQRVAASWKELVGPDDLVLLPGDISWAKRVEDALPDLAWIDALPGKKVMIRGNHDYWWPSSTKLGQLPFKSIQYIHNNAVTVEGVAIGGSRLWDNDEINISEYFHVEPSAWAEKESVEENQKVYTRELVRLEESLKKMDPNAKLKIAMVHYPPVGPDLKSTPASDLLEKYKVDICVFGHLHGLAKPITYGSARGVTYYLTSCDHLKCNPLEITV